MEYINKTDHGFITQMANLSAKAPTVLTVGMTPADFTTIATDYTAIQTAVLDVTAKQTAAQSATQSKKVTRAGVEKRLRALVKRIKAHANYTPAIGELLGIVAPGSAGGAGQRALATEANIRPQLKGDVIGEGVGVIRFNKKSFTGVMLYCRRGSEEAFTLLTKQITSPVTDDRPNLSEGLPEMREYKALFIKKDQPVGQMSDILVLTVPAKGAAKATDTTTLPTAA